MDHYNITCFNEAWTSFSGDLTDVINNAKVPDKNIFINLIIFLNIIC